MENEKLIERSKELGDTTVIWLEDVKEHPNVGDIRGKGLLLGIELVEDKQTKEPASIEKMNKVINACKEKRSNYW